MGAFLRYLRLHPWQRRMMTTLAAMLIGLAAAAYVMPYVRQYYNDKRLIAELANPDAKERLKAVYKVARIAKDNALTLDRLRRALDTPNDRQFTAIVRVLRELGQFDAAGRPELLDRVLAIDLETTQSPDSRRIILMPALVSQRDNAYVHRALKSAAADPAPEIRAMAATLAAKLGNDATLLKLLADADAGVSARAALDAGIAHRSAAAPALEKLLESPQIDVCSAAAYALACLDSQAYAGRICSRLEQTADDKLRARLLHVAVLTDSEAARKTVTNMVRQAEQQDRLLSGAELIACGKLALAEAEPAIRKVLDAAGRVDPSVTVGQALAAVDAAERMKLPVRAEMYRLCENLWNPSGDFLSLLAHAARSLGAQAAMPQGGRGDEPNRQQCVRLLQSLALFSMETPATNPATSPATDQAATTAATSASETRDLTTPLPSAAAAVALWELDAPLADEFVREATVNERLLVGDAIAWGLATGPRKDQTFALGLDMLPDITSSRRVYFEYERAAGAMLLALSALTDQQRQTAVARIEPRLSGEEPNYLVRGSYRCSLLILGQEQRLDDVRLLLETGLLQRRVLTALLLAGDKQALDWLLANPQIGPEQIAETLVIRGVQDVLRAAAPSLPLIDPGANIDLELWQVRILCDQYMIGRGSLKLNQKP